MEETSKGVPAQSGARSAYVAHGILAIIWGYTWVVIKVGTHDASPMFVAGMRTLLGVVALFATLLVMGRSLLPTPFIDTLIYGLLAAGIAWAVSVVWVKRLREKRDVDLLSLTAWQMLWGTIPLVAIMVAVPEQVRLRPALIGSLLFLAVVAQAAA